LNQVDEGYDGGDDDDALQKVVLKVELCLDKDHLEQ
jgi:hypothetical protein